MRKSYTPETHVICLSQYYLNDLDESSRFLYNQEITELAQASPDRAYQLCRTAARLAADARIDTHLYLDIDGVSDEELVSSVAAKNYGASFPEVVDLLLPESPQTVIEVVVSVLKRRTMTQALRAEPSKAEEQYSFLVEPF